MREGFIVYIRSWLTGHDRRQHAELVKRLPLHSRSWLSKIRRQRGEKEDGDPDAEEEDYDDATKDAYGARRRELRCGEERQNSNAEERDESSNADEEDEGPDAEEQGGRSRKDPESGKRPRQHIRETDCPFRFVVQWQHRKGKWQLGVKLGKFYHNHYITRETYSTYPCALGVSVVVAGARVEGILAVGAKRPKINDYLLEHDRNVIKADVDNSVQDFASLVSSLDENDATAAEVVF
ncbi:hypothetical protein PC110_g13140 [Phytophthora cactorum]|uniref:Uncharacterized protein n=1 Tax=Phytophthora cactorum TaxID=29920 RepID=A0A329S0R7_9STRA|nr:hypothetical protein PC110_g13140 [Phytophthora cactorum]